MVLAIPRMVEAVPRRRAPENDDLGPLARALVRLRGERGWMQSDVVRRAGLTQPYYSSLETGAILRPRSDKLLALDAAFDLEPGTLERMIRQEQGLGALSGSNIEMTFGPEGEIVALVRRIPSRRRPQVIEILKTFVEDDFVS